jgi:hypothetical protein
VLLCVVSVSLSAFLFLVAFSFILAMAPLREALAEVSPNKPGVSRNGSKISKDMVTVPRTRLVYPASQLSLQSSQPVHSQNYVHINSSPPRPASREERLASPVPLIPESQSEVGRRSEPTSCRTAAVRLKARLRLAYFKVRTNQTTVSLSDLRATDEELECDESTGESDDRVGKTQTLITPRKPSLHYNISSSPLKGPLLSTMVKGTPASMGAAKSLLRLGDC